ncbi:hypothetical protein PR003_g30975 [Phytophthora rubi]|uniref:DDE-1 domain-containing protein n=1 Tax=Phytophthora rubi TaxID=129364 RepID=A0A6A4BAQ1_9STRA|nr:hypothetical protein PR003_g30975 [Phytophthora rubi]
MSESSNINGALFMQWLKWFVGKLSAARPQLLILDGHFAHVNYDAVVWAMRQDVHLFVLPAHTSHFLQPLDVGIYQTFKQLYEKELQQYQLREGLLPTRDDIATLTKVPFETAFCGQNARKAFELASIYPLSIDKMLPGLVGNSPPTGKASLRHHSVVALSVTPASKKRSGGTYVDEQFSGGVLLTHTEMLDSLHGKKRAKLEKEQAKAERALAKERAKVARLQQAEEKQRMKAKQAQERLSPV